MKSKIFTVLKIVLSLAFGVFIIWLFYDALCADQRTQLFQAFKDANYFWVFLGVLMSWLAFMSRAYRWKFSLEPMGHKVKFWQLYHSVAIGYLVNMVFPRAGEASRAGVIAKSDGVPFQKGFGSILAERAVDASVLATIALVTFFMQSDRYEMFTTKMDEFQSGRVGCGNTVIFSILGKIVLYGVLAGVVLAVVLFVIRPSFRSKLRDFVAGIFEGLLSIFRMQKKVAYLGHTALIWLLYIGMFYVNFQAVDGMEGMGWDAIFAGFVAGAVGIVLVQGGIGLYPAFVGLTVSMYIPGVSTGIAPEALAMGWIAWTAQAVGIVVFGLISLALAKKS